MRKQTLHSRLIKDGKKDAKVGVFLEKLWVYYWNPNANTASVARSKGETPRLKLAGLLVKETYRNLQRVWF